MNAEERGLLRAVERLALRAPWERRFVVRRLTMPERRTLIEFWPAWAHAGQAPPRGPRPTWAIVAGRGFGKTRAGAEWVSGLARTHGAGTRIALAGATAEDVRKVMIGGESGLLAVARTGEPVRFARTEGVVRFASGRRPSSIRGRALRNCAGRSTISPGATRSRSGGTRRRRGTISSSG